MKKVLVDIVILPKFSYITDVIHLLLENWECLVIEEESVSIVSNPDCILIYDSSSKTCSLKQVLILNEKLQFDDAFDRLINLQPQYLKIKVIK